MTLYFSILFFMKKNAAAYYLTMGPKNGRIGR